MKDFEITLRVRNNQLKERREALGMSQRDMAYAINIGVCSYKELESMKTKPTRNGRWKNSAIKISEFHGVEIDELFPQSVLGVENPVVTKKTGIDEIIPLISSHQKRLLLSPDEACEQSEILEKIRNAFDKLPQREASVLMRRFGLDGDSEGTFSEIADVEMVTAERARQLTSKALFRMRKHLSKEKIDF